MKKKIVVKDLVAENRKLQKENKQLRDDLCELSREYTKNNKK